MMGKISFDPLAFESLGARSMSSFIETPDVRILIDPGVSLGIRFGLLPHPAEYRTRAELRNIIVEKSKEADVVTISHYHHDHYTPNFTDSELIGSSPEEATELIQDKILLVKDYHTSVNTTQRRRGWLFWKFAERHAKEIRTADKREFHFGSTSLRFSQPVFHGETGSGLGWVIMLTVSCDDESITHASDVQGPIDETCLDSILSENPNLLVVGGPPIYLSGTLVKEELIRLAGVNLARLCEKLPTTVVDHHLMRSPDWRDFVDPILQAAYPRKNTVQSAADYKGSPIRLLECKRKDLYAEEPPSQEFTAWTRLPEYKRRLEAPPV
jgi:predicted metallo-beta-lactamase superfamily hydrolase